MSRKLLLLKVALLTICLLKSIGCAPPKSSIDYYADSDRIIRVHPTDVLIQEPNEPNSIGFDGVIISLRKYFECLEYRDRAVPPELSP